MYKIFLFLLLLIWGFFAIDVYQTFGASFNVELKREYITSSNYDQSLKRFVNPNQPAMDIAQHRAINWKIIKDYFTVRNQRDPDYDLPGQIPDLIEFLSGKGGFKVVWFGHSTFLLNMEGVTILVDPVFGNASPFFFFGRRYMQPVLNVEELPDIDIVLISHDHYDHLEADTVRFFVNTETEFIVPLGVGEHLRAWGIKANQITERDWWQSVEQKSITFVATPAQHYSGRRGFGGNQSLWASWVIQSKNHSAYFSGDGGYASHFKKIGERYGPFDVAFMETGQYNEVWKMIHLLPEDGVQAFHDINADRYFPVHWGMYTLALHSWFDPAESISRLAEQHQFSLVTPIIGQVVNLERETLFPRWWKQ
jgi:L-ascorbate metabolism protein UlaG (beta-lactamase superfamily)